MSAELDNLPSVCFLCTGNAARSVIARAVFADRITRYQVIGAGTLVLEGQPMSQRTRRSLELLGLEDTTHRSRQFGLDHILVDLIVAMAPEHVEWIRRNHPESAARTGTLIRLSQDLPTEGPLDERIAALRLGEVVLEEWEEVADPASGQQEVFDLCAQEVEGLVERLIERLP